MKTKKPLQSINPCTEEVLVSIDALSKEDIDTQMQKARQAHKQWAALPVKERLGYFDRLSELVSGQADEIARLITEEQGKTIVEAKAAEIMPVLATIKSLKKNDYKALQNRRIRHDMILFTHKKSRCMFVPFGIIGVISAWNYPFSVPMMQILPAVAAGNAVVFKPAPGVILISQKIQKLFAEAGFPEGVVNTLFIHDDEAPYLAGHKDIDKLIFTGSTETGFKVMRTAAAQMTPVILELGGKDPAVIAADADLRRTAKGVVWGSMFNSGQVCAAVERVYVERRAAGEFIRLCVEETKKLTIGDPLQPGTDIGPLENKKQMQVVLAQIEDAVSKGAKVETGGKRIGEKGFFIEPTVLTRVNHSMKVMTEETFGPVLPVMEVDSIDQAISMANESPYGLSAYGWTSSRKTAEKMERELHAGTVMINDATSSWGEPQAPWGGFKKSGIGRTHSAFGLREMVQVKYVSYDKGNNTRNLWWFPYDKSMDQIMKNAVRFLFSCRLGEKLRAGMTLMKYKRFVKNVHWKYIILNIKKLF